MQRGLSICSCMHSLKGEEDFSSFSPALAQRRGGLLLFLACTRSKARRSSSFLAYTSLKGEEDFFSCLKTHESVEGFKHYWCLRSPKDDEVFKTFNYCRRSPKNDGDLVHLRLLSARRLHILLQRAHHLHHLRHGYGALFNRWHNGT